MTTPPPVLATRRRVPLKPLLILLGGGAILAFGGCAMFLSAANQPTDSSPTVWGAAFVVGVLMIVAGFGYGLVLIIMSFIRKK